MVFPAVLLLSATLTASTNHSAPSARLTQPWTAPTGAEPARSLSVVTTAQQHRSATAELPHAVAQVDELMSQLGLLHQAYRGNAFSASAFLDLANAATSDARSRQHSQQRTERRLQGVETKDAMRGKTITIVTMADPPFVKLDSAEGAALAYSGYCIDMMAEVASLAGFTYQFVPRTSGELANGWGGAVNDVAAGRTDIFWSTFFLTSSRAAIVDVSSSYMDTGLIVVALANLQADAGADGAEEQGDQTPLATLIKAPFRPFSTPLWGLIGVTVLAYSLVIFIFERSEDKAELSAEELCVPHLLSFSLLFVPSPALAAALYLRWCYCDEHDYSR